MKRHTRAQANSSRIACTTCHRRKVRCDAHDSGFPCKNCEKAGLSDQCQVHVKRRRVSQRRRLEQSNTDPRETEIIVRTSEGRAPSVQTPQRSCPFTPGDELVPPPLDTARIDCSLPHAPGPERGGIAHNPENTPYQSNSCGASDFQSTFVVDNDYKKYLVEFIDQPQLAGRPIDKDARILYIGSGLSNINFLLGQHYGPGAAEISHYPTNRIPRYHTCHEPDRLPVEAFQLPAKETVDKLLEAFFSLVNPGFPVVDKTTFMTQYKARDPQNPPSLLLLQSILVVGAHAFYDDPQDRDQQKSVFFRRAKTLFDARFERNRDTIVQAALLLTWHADGPEDVGANAWHWVGVAARHATGLGMHRDAEGSTLVPHNKRMWRRVWWLLFQCDVLVSLQYGRPQVLRLEDSDVRPLQMSDFQDCGEEAENRCTYVIKMTELCIIISEVLRHQYRLTFEPSKARCRSTIGLEPSGTETGNTPPSERRDSGNVERIAIIRRRADEALAKWSLHLPPSLQRVASPGVDIWAANLQLQYNTTLILLHRQLPFENHHDKFNSRGTTQALSGPTDNDRLTQGRAEDMEICSNAAVAIQQILDSLCHDGNIVTRCLWIPSVINCVFTALIHLSIEVCIANPVLSVTALRRYDSALASLRRLCEAWPNAQSIIHFFEDSVRLKGLRGNGSGIGVHYTGPRLTPATGSSQSQSQSILQPIDARVNTENETNPNILSGATFGSQIPSSNTPNQMGVMGGGMGSLEYENLTQLLSSSLLASGRLPSSNELPLTNSLSDVWGQWLQFYWQPECTEDFLFTF